MKAQELREKYLDFFAKKGHQIIPSASLIPEEKVDLAGTQKVLFTTAGMHPLVPYLLGEPHPHGKRLVNVQKCLRTDDLDQVGDAWHNTFFEMLGNWSLGDYWKEEAISWSLEFLTKELKLSKERIFVTVFAGDKDSPKDEETEKIWQKLGISKEKIFPLPKSDNWWGPVGESGPCGPDTEMFYDAGKEKCGSNCRPGCPCGKYAEIWNDVFMEYNKTPEGKYDSLRQKNVDTGMGVERTTAILQEKDNVYETELFWPIIQKIEEISGRKYKDHQKETRIVTDHLKAAVFLAQEGIEPDNKQQGYVMRRLIRRAVVKMRQAGIVPLKVLPHICQEVIKIYETSDGKNLYFDKPDYKIHPLIGAEINVFEPILSRNSKLLQAEIQINGKKLFDFYQSEGLPFEVAIDLLEQGGRLTDKKRLEKEFNEELKKHQELSRTASLGMFKGGLADQSGVVTKYHTATHLLHQALREILGAHVEQAGSNITEERLRFDFSHPQKMTEEETRKVEALVNQKIKENLPVKMETMSHKEAMKSEALAFFGQKYGEKVKVYSIGNFSKEVCGGPHVDFTGRLGNFKIKKEESAAKGIRRIYASLE